jgi:hypothetical protein
VAGSAGLFAALRAASERARVGCQEVTTQNGGLRLELCLKSLEEDLTPKVLANFSPGFPTLGQSASIEILTLKEFHPVA